jgi:hypothetical protein
MRMLSILAGSSDSADPDGSKVSAAHLLK